METVGYELRGVVPPSSTGIRFVRLEMTRGEFSPLALVWYTLPSDTQERGARIDLQKQIFIDDFGENDRGSFGAEARLIVSFLNSSVGNRAMMTPSPIHAVSVY